MENTAVLVDEILHGQGYVLLPELFSPQEMAAARDLILATAAAPDSRCVLASEGRSRVYGLLQAAAIFRQMVQHPQVIAVTESILGADMTLGGFSAHVLYPGAASMGAHVDYPYFTMEPPYPQQPVLEIQAIWLMEEFTANNGAPAFVAGSQKLGRFPEPAEFTARAQKVTGPPGSLVLSHGLCWHDTSENHAEQPRVSVLGNYTPKYIRPLENPLGQVGPELLSQSDPKLRQLLGLEFQSSIFKDAVAHLNTSYA